MNVDRNGVKGLLWISSGTEFIRNSIMAAFLRRSLLTETRVAVGLVTAIGSAYVGAFVFNLTEQKRMARQIISGNLRKLNSEPCTQRQILSSLFDYIGIESKSGRSLCRISRHKFKWKIKCPEALFSRTRQCHIC